MKYTQEQLGILEKAKPVRVDVVCPYCGNKSNLVSGNDIYPHRLDLGKLNFYMCKPCDAYVGTHKGTIIPLGRLANKELRAWKRKAHDAFDPIWKSKDMGRRQAYYWLADKLDIPKNDCHIGDFDTDTCRKVVDICSKRFLPNK